ncbi:MAG: RNA polymerase subunit sigma-70 [Thalassobius sp.]|nr:RNA polymerase subunit sigma-70 [Thalassovita sp.]
MNYKEPAYLGNNEDSNLIKQLINGEEWAFTQTFEKYSSQVFYIALKYLKNKELAEDVVQETFIRVWNNRTTLKPTESLKPFIVTISKRLILNIIRNEKRKILKHVEILASQNPNKNFTEQSIFYNETNNQLKSAINKLPEKRKQVFELKVKEGLSNEEIAKKLGISVNTVKVQYSKALQQIRELLNNYYSLLIISLFFIK